MFSYFLGVPQNAFFWQGQIKLEQVVTRDFECQKNIKFPRAILYVQRNIVIHALF